MEGVIQAGVSSGLGAEVSVVEQVLAWITVIAFAALAGIVLWKLAVGRIQLRGLISEPGSEKASLSRFQFLVFTFVIAGSFLMIALRTGTMPEVPPGVYALLGISGLSYVASKGIQRGVGTEEPSGDPIGSGRTAGPLSGRRPSSPE